MLINSVDTRISNSRIANNSSSDLINNAIIDIRIDQNNYKQFMCSNIWNISTSYINNTCS